MRAAADRALTRPRLRGLAALIALAALVVTGFLALEAIEPPAAEPVGAPTGEFSAGRAFQQVEAIATVPHPAGSAANDRVREHLVTTLQGYGLKPEVQDTVSGQGGELSSSAGGYGLAHVRNVVTLIPGSAPTGRIFLVAHYDSVQNGPGGNDDAAGVSTLLETARALTQGPQQRNDIVLLLTDAEEACLCGAEAFVTQHTLAQGKGVAVNVEARGSKGPAIMFETSKNNRALVDLYGRTPKPVGTSFAVEIYRLLPNDTDFSPFRDNGFSGLNSAYIDGSAVYHAPTDVPSAMDKASLQHHGENTLALARLLGGIDLATTTARGDATYFPAPWGQVTYPGQFVWPLAVLAVVAVLVLAWFAQRRGLTSGGRIAGAFVSALVPILLAPVLALALWAALKIMRSGYAAFSVDPYRPLWYRCSVLAIVAFVVFVWYALLRRRLSPAAMAIGGLGWLAVLGVGLAVVAPGGSYLTALPALVGSLAGMVAIALRGGWGSLLAVVVGAAVAVIVLLPAVVMLFPALGLVLGAVGAFLAVLMAMALVPIVDLLHPDAGVRQGLPALRARRAGLVPSLLALLAVVSFAAVGLKTDRFDAAHPIPTQLMYALDADNSTARWLSAETHPQAWTAHYVKGSPVSVQDTLPAFGPEKLLTGPAQAATLPAPQLTVQSDTTTGDLRTLKLLLKPQRQVRLVTLHVEAPAAVTKATVDGVAIPGAGFVFHAPPADGITIEVTVRASGPVKFRAMDASDGLSALPGFVARPADVGILGSHISEMLAVAKTYSF